VDTRTVLLKKLCEQSAKIAANTVYGGYNLLTIENAKGQVEAYSIAILLAYGKITSPEELELDENMEFLAKVVKEYLREGFTTGDKRLDDALLFSYQLS